MKAWICYATFLANKIYPTFVATEGLILTLPLIWFLISYSLYEEFIKDLTNWISLDPKTKFLSFCLYIVLHWIFSSIPNIDALYMEGGQVWMLGWQITAFWLKLVGSYFCIYYYYYYYYKVNFHTVIEIQVLQFTGNNIFHQFSLFH